MALQARVNQKNVALIKSGRFLNTQSGLISQDAGRTAGDLLTNTVMGKVAASGEFVPYTDITAVDGSAIPAGIYIGDDILEADIIAGNISDNIIALLGDAATFDVDELVLENSVALDDIIGTGVTLTTVGDELKKIGFIAETTVLITETENA